MSKDKLKEEFKQLPKKDQKELIQEYITHEQFSTDDDSEREIHYSKNLINIDKEALIGDKYGNSALSLAIEEGDIEQVRKIFVVKKDLSDADLLRTIAVDMMDKNIQKEYGLSQDIVSVVYSEAKYQLKVMGEDIDSVIDAYDLDI